MGRKERERDKETNAAAPLFRGRRRARRGFAEVAQRKVRRACDLQTANPRHLSREGGGWGGFKRGGSS